MISRCKNSKEHRKSSLRRVEEEITRDGREGEKRGEKGKELP
jgi:hypothetical protein